MLLELQLLDLAVGGAQLVLEPLDLHHEAGGIAAVVVAAGAGDVGGRQAVLGEAQERACARMAAWPAVAARIETTARTARKLTNKVNPQPPLGPCARLRRSI